MPRLRVHNFSLSLDGYAAGANHSLNSPIGAGVPILVGKGERLFDHLDGGPLGYRCVELVASRAVAHARFVTRAPDRR
ncbi:MAG: hypothetical protein QOJ52_2269 [Acidimicrobiaceae bacterium]|nr:hypothetical protein [Acidimicrobiaceae bacterium]